MARKPFLCNPINPYSLSARSHDKRWFPIPIEETWEIMSRYLFYLHHVFDVKIHSFVLMSNHFHLIASFPQANLSHAMQYFMRETSRQISSGAGQINQIYGNRCYRSQLSSPHYFMNAYKYIYQNPVAAHICDKVEDYNYSTLNRLLGGGRLDFPVTEDTILFDSPETAEPLLWLNRPPEPGHREFMRKALRRKIFQLPKINRRPNELELALY